MSVLTKQFNFTPTNNSPSKKNAPEETKLIHLIIIFFSNLILNLTVVCIFQTEQQQNDLNFINFSWLQNHFVLSEFFSSQTSETQSKKKTFLNLLFNLYAPK